MSVINKAILIGHLGKDPERRDFEGGKVKTTFPLATSEFYKNKEGKKQENTQWHNIVFWGPVAEVAEKYLKKGRQVYIEGRITTRSYADKEGTNRYITEIVGQQLTLLGKGKDSEGPKQEVAPLKPTPVEGPAKA